MPPDLPFAMYDRRLSCAIPIIDDIEHLRSRTIRSRSMFNEVNILKHEYDVRWNYLRMN